jgi:hypothetical protein
MGSSGKSSCRTVGDDEEMEGCMIGSFREPISENKLCNAIYNLF